MKHAPIKLLSLGLSIFFTVSPHANASFEKNTQGKLTQLLSHAPQVMNVYEAEKQGLNASKSAFQPWSGSYWPDIVGNIASHYRDRSSAGTKVSMVMNYNNGRKRYRGDFEDVKKNITKWDTQELNQKLSPSEKYDLLLGDLNFTLTNAIMDEIDFRASHKLVSVADDGTQVDESSIYEGDGTAFSADKLEELAFAHPKVFKWAPRGHDILALWSGICDGWGPASIYLPRPVKPVTLVGALGQTIIFYPDDLKALGSYLFARTNTPYMATMNYQYAGKRCDEKGKPGRDGGTGMVDDMRCNDVDAAVWHGALLNRIGKDKLGFIMDIDNNTKVNNHPVYAYKLTYFNPSNGEEGTLKQSMIKLKDIRYDGYSYRRNPNTVYLVGVKSKIDYGNYTWAEDNKDNNFDSAVDDVSKDIEYTYDLELDADGNIIGGEWGDRSSDRRILTKVKYATQPDFIWMAAPDALPYSAMSSYAYVGDKKDFNRARPFGNTKWAYDGKTLPADWVNASKKDAQWKAPVVDTGTNTEEAIGSILKSAQPFSPIIYYLFDQARSVAQD